MSKDISSYAKTKKPLDDFSKAIIRTILKIPRGKVATYGQVAELAGYPQRPRQVGMVLRFNVDIDRVPWQRVIGASGRILFPKRNKNFKLQRKLLEDEGVRFVDGKVNFDQFRWAKKLPRKPNTPRLFAD